MLGPQEAMPPLSPLRHILWNPALRYPDVVLSPPTTRTTPRAVYELMDSSAIREDAALKSRLQTMLDLLPFGGAVTMDHLLNPFFSAALLVHRGP